jgi:AraC-like DNA-binding protein
MRISPWRTDAMRNGDLEITNPDQVPRAVYAAGMALVTDGVEHPTHRHGRAQIILAIRGLVRCVVADGLWMVPRQCALWIPGGVEHGVRCAGDLEAYVMLVDPAAAPRMPQVCTTFSVGPLLRELMVAVSDLPALYDPEGPDGRLIQTMLDQLGRAPVESLHLPMPGDARLRRIADVLLADPGDRKTPADWARAVAMSERSLFRLVLGQTGMSFGRWRRQFQVTAAIERLAQGASVQTVAFALGYESASAFVTMFRKAMGQPPGRYLAARQATMARA